MYSLHEIEAQINLYEPESRELDLTAAERGKLHGKVQNSTEDFLRKLKDKKAFHDNHADVVISEKWAVDQPSSMDWAITLLQEEMDGHGLNPASGGHLGYIPGGGIYPAALGDYIAAVTNHYSTVHYAGPAAVELENYLIRWMGKILGFSDDAVGNLTSGGSIANLQAIVVARDYHKIQDKNHENCCIYLIQQAHHSLGKAFNISGLKNCLLRYVNVTPEFRMDMQHFEKLVEEDVAQGKYPFLCITSLGTTDTGAVDSIEEASAICVKHNLWLHVDAAYGGFFKLVEDDLHIKVNQLHLADSITIDPHKGLFLPYGTGACLFKNPKDLYASFHQAAGYMQDAAHQHTISSADISIELSRHFRGLRMWLPLKLMGVERFKAALREKLWLCRYFYLKIYELGFEVGPFPDLSVMIYRYNDASADLNKLNKKLIDKMHQDGTVFISSTTIDGEVWLRMAILNFRTHKETIDTCLHMLGKYIKEL